MSPEGIARKGMWKNGKRLHWVDEMGSDYNATQNTVRSDLIGKDRI